MDKQIVVEPISTAIAIKAQKDAPVMLRQAEAVVINTQQQYEAAKDMLDIVKGAWKSNEANRKTIAAPLNLAKAALQDLFRNPLETFKKAESIIKTAMIAYDDKMEAKRREEQRKIDAKAREEEERKRKQLEKRAEEWAAKGKTAKAEELQEQAEEVEVVAPVVAVKIEKPKGVSYRDKYSVDKITDAEKVPREYLEINIAALNAIAQATKGLAKIAGVTFKCEKILASRGY